MYVTTGLVMLNPLKEEIKHAQTPQELRTICEIIAKLKIKVLDQAYKFAEELLISR